MSEKKSNIHYLSHLSEQKVSDIVNDYFIEIGENRYVELKKDNDFKCFYEYSRGKGITTATDFRVSIMGEEESSERAIYLSMVAKEMMEIGEGQNYLNDLREELRGDQQRRSNSYWERRKDLTEEYTSKVKLLEHEYQTKIEATNVIFDAVASVVNGEPTDTSESEMGDC